MNTARTSEGHESAVRICATVAEVKFTPGPWRVFEHSWSDTSILADGFDHAICSLDINHATEESQVADEALMAANARLIAAAPELLAALQLATESLAGGLWDYGPGQDEHERCNEVIEELRAAIAKATS